MTGLMLMFMLIALIFMIKVDADSKRVIDKTVQYSDLRAQLYQDLWHEFATDLPGWKANLNNDLSVRFEEPEGQFATGDSSLQPKFRAILDSFIPRYVRILASEKYRGSVEEIRVEGHTSSFWKDKSSLEAYFANMELSQRRTRTTLQFALTLPTVIENQGWMKEKLTANGLSSSRLRYAANGSEDLKLSQRVEFRVRLNADDRLNELRAAVNK